MISRETLELCQKLLGHVTISAPVASEEFEVGLAAYRTARQEIEEALNAAAPPAGS